MDSKQWAKDLPAEVREVLDAGAALGAPDGAKQAVWSALAAKLPAATAGAAAGGLSALSILKPLAVGLALGGALTVGVLEIRSKTAPAPRLPASASAGRAASVPARPRPSEFPPIPINEPAPVSSSAPASRAAPPSTAPGSSLGESSPLSGASSVAAFPDAAVASPQEDRTVRESRRLNQARAALQVGDARRALLQIEAIAGDFPNGVLVQERDALRIEALFGLGERQRARELAVRFLERYPHSPHTAAVQRALH